MEKRKHRFNIIDAAVIVLLVGAAVLLTLHFVNRRENADKNIPLTFVMQTDMIPEELADNVEVGDPVFDGDSGIRIGVVTECDSRAAQHVGKSKSGASVISDVAGYRQLYVTCEASGNGAEDKFTVDGVMISSGRRYRLMMPSLYCEAECITVDRAPDEN